MRKTNILMAVAALSTVSAASLAAQTPDRQGFYADVGANYSWPSNELKDGGSVTDHQAGVAWTLGIGTGLKNNKVRIGLQADYLKTTDVFKNDLGPGVDGEIWMYSAAIAFYPKPEKDMWVKVNLGYGTNKLSGSGESASAGGFMAGLTVGIDVPVGKGGFVIDPYLGYLDTFSTGDYDGALSGEGIKGSFNMFQVGVTLGYKH